MRTWSILALATLAGVSAGLVFGKGVAAQLLPEAGDHGAWYASRASGVISYLLIWVSLFGGLMMSSAWFDGYLHRGRLLAMHQAAGVGGVLLGAAHALVLIPDGWTQFGLVDLFVPFGSYYERTLSAIGTLTLYLSAVVAFSFWFRSRIGMKAWRYIHYTSFAVYGGALWHGLNIGTDSRTVWLLGIYVATSLLVTFALVVRITYKRVAVKRVPAAPRPAPAPASPSIAEPAA